jgi:hypothetical protein
VSCVPFHPSTLDLFASSLDALALLTSLAGEGDGKLYSETHSSLPVSGLDRAGKVQEIPGDVMENGTCHSHIKEFGNLDDLRCDGIMKMSKLNRTIKV